MYSAGAAEICLHKLWNRFKKQIGESRAFDAYVILLNKCWLMRCCLLEITLNIKL